MTPTSCLRPLASTFILLTLTVTADRLLPAESADPLAEVYARELRPSVASLMEQFRRIRKYKVDDFPLPPDEFRRFQAEVISQFVSALDLENWVVRNPKGKQSPIKHLFNDRIVSRLTHDGVEIEAHVIEIPATGDRIPAVVCLPPGEGRRPAVACFSGHSENGLRDLVFDPESYQRAVATRLAKAGFVTVAVEKVDSGYLSRTAPSGVDEEEITTFRLGLGSHTRAIQLMATVAAVEILAAHPRVDETRIGATGVSLGGWLSIQTALLSDRIKAVAEYGAKSVYLGDEVSVEDFGGVNDLCHIIPGTFQLGDRNILLIPYAPRPLLSGHGGPTDKVSHGQYKRYYQDVYEAQYEALGKLENFRYHIHDDGHTIAPDTVIDYFREVFGDSDE